jgi:tetratricopeptide (TPR) repeat protein
MAFRVLPGLALSLALISTSPAGTPPTVSFEQSVEITTRWELGYYLFQMQDYGAAAAEFEKIRRLLPRDPTLLALIGSCYSMSGRWSEGEKALQQARAENPSDADVNGLLGQFYLTAKLPLKGAYYLEQALRQAPEMEDLRAKVAEVYADARQFAKARAHLEVLLRDRGNAFGDPDLDNAYARCLLASGKYREGAPYALKAHQSAPADPRYARTLGLAMLGLNRFVDAARLISASRPWMDGDADLYRSWGEALFQDRRWDEAEAAWLEGTRKFPDAYGLLSRLLEFYFGSAQPEKAERVAAYARVKNPAHPGNLLLEARLSRKQGNFSQARMALERLKRRAGSPLLYEGLWEQAQLEYETGRFFECGKVLERVMAGSRKAEAHLLRAKLAMKSGNLPVAQAQLLQAHAANPCDLKVYALARIAFGSDKEKLAELLRDEQSMLAGADRFARAAAQ